MIASAKENMEKELSTQNTLTNSMDIEIPVKVSDLLEREKIRSLLNIVKQLTEDFYNETIMNGPWEPGQSLQFIGRTEGFVDALRATLAESDL